jgi:preprotein translocase subunit SecF
MAHGTTLGARLYSGETSFDFIASRKRWYAISTLLLLLSIGTIAFQGLQLGIEFKGGASYTVTKAGATVEDARSAVESVGVSSELIVQSIGNEKIRVQTGTLTSVESNAVQDALAAQFGISVESIDTQIIGPSWGKEITKKALYGLFGFLIAVMLYLAMTFEFKMAVAAIAAVVHDVTITVGIYALVGFDVTPATVIGFLTILGYSLYDTVIVFDKVRENTRAITTTGKSTFSQATNLAINQTIVRSINTSVIALLPVGSILFVGAGLLGAGTLKDVSLALFIGLAIGTYSSLFIAPQILAGLREREPAMIALTKRVNARSGAAPVSVQATENSTQDRGPRNQPKRKAKKK